MQTKNRNHFSEESKAYRAKVRKAFHEVGLISNFRNKRVGGYTDKYGRYSTDLEKVIETCEKVGVEYKVVFYSERSGNEPHGVIVYIPNQN